MTSKRKLLRLATVSLIILAIFICPLGSFPNSFQIQADATIHFTPNVDEAFLTQTAEALEIDAIIPVPTLGPGQAFDTNTKPSLSTQHGNEEFGYGEIAGEPDLILSWTRDDNGTQYLVVRADDPLHSGSGRPDTFTQLVEDRESKIAEVEETRRTIDNHLKDR
jgi:hypothetical protein